VYSIEGADRDRTYGERPLAPLPPFDRRRNVRTTADGSVDRDKDVRMHEIPDSDAAFADVATNDRRACRPSPGHRHRPARRHRSDGSRETSERCRFGGGWRTNVLACLVTVVAVVSTAVPVARASPEPIRPEPIRHGSGERETIVLRGSTDHDADPVRFVPPPAGDAGPTPLGAGWRHDFDLVLTKDGRDLIVRDERGIRHRFRPASTESAGTPSAYVAGQGADGDVVTRDGTHVWRRPDASEVTFRGSQPVDIRFAHGEATTLRYDAGRLVSAIRDDGGTTTFEHEGGRLRAVTLGDGTRFDTSLTGDGGLSVRRRGSPDECRPGDGPRSGPDDGLDDGSDDHEEGTDDRCDTARHPPGIEFTDGPGLPGAVRVDARPASCRSYFVDYYGTERGSAIERALDGLPHYAGYAPTVGNFPVADFIGHEIRVVRTRDLASPTYDAVADGLHERLLRDGREIAEGLLEPLARDGRLASTELGRTTTLVHREDRSVVLELVVRHGLASDDQRAQIRRAAAELLARHGIVLRVVEIP